MAIHKRPPPKRANLVRLTCADNQRKFRTKSRFMQHRKEVQELKNDDFSCGQCGKQFGQRNILDLHRKLHESLLGSSLLSSPQKGKENLMEGDETGTDSKTPSKIIPSSCQRAEVIATFSTLSPGKKVGLTRVKMEDCLRCDECSCIYINEDDYHKHMRNFHRKDSPRKSKPRKACWSCCKNCNCKDLLSTIQKDRGNNNLFHYNIKDRWSKISSRLQLPPKSTVKKEPKEDVQIKQELMEREDYSHLLSQVEVKIKMEPLENISSG